MKITHLYLAIFCMLICKVSLAQNTYTYTLIDADNNTSLISSFNTDITWNIDNSGGLNLISDLSVYGIAHQVRFTTLENTRTEGTLPYAYYGDLSGSYGQQGSTYYGWQPAVGTLFFTVEYLDTNLNVMTIDTFTINFIDNNTSTPDTQDPTAPTLSSVAETDTTASLSWSGATDDTAVTGYKIFKDGILEGTLGNVGTYQVTGLTASTSYSFTVTAQDAAGNESVASNGVSVTTDNSNGFGNNLAFGKLAEQSSNYENYYAENSIDGDTNTYTHTQSELNAWLKVDLGAVYNINTIVVYNRITTNPYVASRLDGVKIGASLVDGSNPSTFSDLGISLTSEFEHVFQNLSFNARYVMIYHPQEEFLNIAELEVYGTNPSNNNGTSSESLWSESGSDIYYSDGNVGVGTSTIPLGYKLAVEGKIITEELKVQLQSAWPDYVFSKEYELPSLKEVERYITEKGHLPKIPSAKEVEENGIEVGEMNKLLLEKIEELTIYIIAMKKEIIELKKNKR